MTYDDDRDALDFYADQEKWEQHQATAHLPNGDGRIDRHEFQIQDGWSVDGMHHRDDR